MNLPYKDAGLGEINNAGYQVAKHGLVSMTRAFITSEPKPHKSEGIKCYALCPVFADTNLVRSAFEKRKEEIQKGTVSSKGQITSMEELSEKMKMRILTVEEVGDAMMKSLEYDKVRGQFLKVYQ